MTSRITLFAVACALLAAMSVATAQDAETEKAIEKYRADAEGGSLEQSRAARCRPRRSAVEHAARTEERLARTVRSRQGARQGRGRVRRTAALFRRRRPRDGRRDPHSLVHGEAAGLQPRRSREAAASGRRPAGQGTRRDRDLCGQQVSRHEVRRQARPAEGEGGGGARRDVVLSAAPGRSISPARPATTPRACASGCRACRSCRIRRRPAR